MDRRGFLKAAAVTGALMHTGWAQDPKRFKLAVKYGMVGGDGTVLEKFQLVKKLGFDGIELDSPSKLKMDEVLKARDQSGLPIHGVVDSVHWRKPLSHPDEKVRAEGRAGLETAIKECKKYGGSTVLLVPAVVNANVSYADAYKRSHAEIAKVLPLAESLSIKIAIENVWNNFLLSPLEAARYVDSFQSKWIGWYLDIGNIVRYGWPEHWIRTLSGRVFKLDIKDYSRKLANDKGLWKGFSAKIGDGSAGWPRVIKALKEIGYTGWATAEVRGGGAERLADIKARMDRVLAQ